jgi:hypothetical protein
MNVQKIYLIDSIGQYCSIPKNAYFSFPRAAVKYYGLKYIIASLKSDKNLYENFILNIGNQFSLIFEVLHTKINKIIIDKEVPTNIIELLKENNIHIFFTHNISFTSIIYK